MSLNLLKNTGYVGHNLPAEYQEVEYIYRNSIEQWINTEVLAASDVSTELSFSWVDISGLNLTAYVIYASPVTEGIRYNFGIYTQPNHDPTLTLQFGSSVQNFTSNPAFSKNTKYKLKIDWI